MSKNAQMVGAEGLPCVRFYPGVAAIEAEVDALNAATSASDRVAADGVRHTSEVLAIS